MEFKCVRCGSVSKSFLPKGLCKNCGGVLECVFEPQTARGEAFSGASGFWRYRRLLPQTRSTVTLGEGGTPLHKADRLAEVLGAKTVLLKDETRNPTHSYRDRAAAFVASHAVDLGFDAAVCATNGNMGASLAAYAAKAGFICHVVVPKAVDVGKLAQMLAYDADIEECGQTVDDSIQRAIALASESGWYQATAELNPLVVEAQKTIAYEVYEQWGVPDCFVVPMGSGGTIYSVWKGFMELHKLGVAASLPKMVGVQPEGCAPIVSALKHGSAEVEGRCVASTRALAVLVGEPLQFELARRAIAESGGLALTVSDEEIVAAELQVAKLEGVFAEPASAATVAALKKLRGEGAVSSNCSVACLITSSGLKATDVLEALTKKRKTVGLSLGMSTKEKILRMLDRGDAYGYELWKKLGRTMTRAAVYQHLNELSSKGLVVSYGEGGKRLFKLTEQGRKALAAFDELKALMH